jgi:hypothetical protein
MRALNGDRAEGATVNDEGRPRGERSGCRVSPLVVSFHRAIESEADRGYFNGTTAGSWPNLDGAA